MAMRSAEDVIKLYTEAKSLRSVHENDWRMAAAYCLPEHYQLWQSEGPSAFRQGMASVRRVAYDTTGARSLPKYVAILERLVTPANQRWHKLTASNPALNKKRRVRQYFQELTDTMFKMRYNPHARFGIATGELYASMGVYGTGPVFVGIRRPTPIVPYAGFKYVACFMRDIFMLTDDDGKVVTVFRRFWLNCRQFKEKFPGEDFPERMKAEAGKPYPSETSYFEFVHYVSQRDSGSYDPEALDARRHPIVSMYVNVESKQYIGGEQGYRSFPYLLPRTSTAPGDAYGLSPAVRVLAALGGASAVKKTNIKVGQLAATPTLLAHDDGVMNGEVDLRPAAVNYGGLTKDGKELIKPLRGGDFRVADALMQDDRNDIEDSFFVTLFQILQETPEMTATEVIERAAEKSSLMAPTMGRLQSEWAGPNIDREVDMMAELGMLPEMPPELVEAEGEYEVVYTSPMAKSMYAEEVSGLMRSVEFALNVSQATQDPSPLDHFNFDEAIPEIADYMAVPARWINDKTKVEDLREGRASQMETAQMLQSAPALASVAKTAMDAGKAK